MFKRYLKYFVYFIAFFVFCQLLFHTAFWQILELKLLDTFFLIRGSQDSGEDIVIVAIDDETFSSLQLNWPFPRSYMARVIENLQKAEVRLIVIDVEFIEYSTPDEDQVLIDTIKDYDNIIMAGKIIEQETLSYSRTQILPPLPEFEKSLCNWGLVNIYPDRDGFVRNYTLYKQVHDQKYYTLGIKALMHLYDIDPQKHILENKRNIQFGSTVIPRFNQNQVIINFFGPAETFRHYSFVDILDDSTFEIPVLNLDRFEDILQNNELSGKIVFIGATAPSLKDYFYTPFTIGERHLSGVEVHCNFLEMARSNNFLVRLDGLRKQIIYLVFAAVAFLLFIILKPSKTVYLMILFIIGGLVLGFILFSVKNMVVPVLELLFLTIIAYIAGLLYNYVKTYKERKFIKAAFQKYLSSELVEELIKHPDNLEYGGSSKVVSILFSDIRGFTTYSEKHTPKETVDILQEYLTSMVSVIKKHNGLIDKFIGDAIVALFNVPLDVDNHELAVCKAALDMKAELERLQLKWNKERKDVFEIGIGINTGQVIVGNLGSEQIFDYTAIGDAVNLTARVESLNKEYKTENNIIITESTYMTIKNRIEARYLDEVLVKGKSKSVKIYELIGLS